MIVICHGNDGHISVEPADHNHCDCPLQEDSNSDLINNDTEIINTLSIDHIHCTDTSRVSTLYATKPVNTKSPILKILSSDIYCILNTVPTYSLNGYSTSIFENFFIPLQTIVLLA